MKTSTEIRKISTSTEPCTTYVLYEDNAGGLHMAIYAEDIYSSNLRGICLSIRPGDIKNCIDDLENWENWHGLVPAHLLNDCGNNLDDKATPISICSIARDGLTQVIYWGRLGIAGREAFAYLDDKEEA